MLPKNKAGGNNTNLNLVTKGQFTRFPVGQFEPGKSDQVPRYSLTSYL